MTIQNENGTNRIVIALAIVAVVLSLAGVLIKYIRSGEIDFIPIGAGIAIPLAIVALEISRKR